MSDLPRQCERQHLLSLSPDRHDLSTLLKSSLKTLIRLQTNTCLINFIGSSAISFLSSCLFDFCMHVDKCYQMKPHCAANPRDADCVFMLWTPTGEALMAHYALHFSINTQKQIQQLQPNHLPDNDDSDE